MTNKDFLLEVHKLCHIESQQCVTMINALCKLMAQAGVEQVPVTLPGLGTFVSHKHPEYMQEDPQTGRMTLYPPRITYRMQSVDPEVSSDILVRQLAENTKTSLTECVSLLSAVVEVIFGSLDHGEEVEVKGLGSFRNIVTHQGELQRVAYTPDAQMRLLVNAPFNCFESIVAEDPSLIADEPASAIAAVASEAADLNAALTEEASEAAEETAEITEETSEPAEELAEITETVPDVVEEAPSNTENAPLIVELPSEVSETLSDVVNVESQSSETLSDVVNIESQSSEALSDVVNAESQSSEALSEVQNDLPQIEEAYSATEKVSPQVEEAHSASEKVSPQVEEAHSASEMPLHEVMEANSENEAPSPQVPEESSSANEPLAATAAPVVTPVEPAPDVKPVTPSSANNVPSSQPRHSDDDYFESLHHRPNRSRNRMLYTACVIILLSCIALFWWIMNMDNDEYNSHSSSVTYAEVEEPEAATATDDSMELAEVNAEIEAIVEEQAAEQSSEPTVPATPVVENPTPQAQTPVADVKPAPAEAPKPAPEKPAASLSDQMYRHNADGSVATHKLQQGERLTLIALKYYGDKCFWPYIYEVNTDKIKSPSLVSEGMVLRLPDASYFGIDASNPKSVAKAKAKAAALLN